MKYLFLFCLIFTFSQTTWAEESERGNHFFGINMGANNTPPGLFGLDLGFNFTDWIQLEFGAGFNSQGLGESVTDELATTMVTTVFYIITLTLVDWDDIRDFVKDEDETVVRTVFSWGGGFNFFYPGWNLSPLLGIGYAGWEAKNGAFDLAEKDQHFFYKVGVDWQTSTGFRLSAGLVHSPDLPQVIRNKAFAQVGYFF